MGQENAGRAGARVLSGNDPAAPTQLGPGGRRKVPEVTHRGVGSLGPGPAPRQTHMLPNPLNKHAPAQASPDIPSVAQAIS